MIQREAKKKLIDLATKFKAVAVTGARQTGKTTLIKEVFKMKPYVSLENLDMRNFALEDPRGFLATYPNGAVLDEVQRTPNLFSYLQEILDNSKEKGLFILSGSNNFLLQQSISQSLAGRIGYINLLPFSLAELNGAKILPQLDDELMLTGFYPPVYDQEIPAMDWCHNYIRTYIEKDVRQIKNISDLVVFEKFIRLLAGRTGQELNNLSLSNEVGVDVKTIQSWIGILESSFIIYLLKPHFKNFNKTILKRPKLYFYDTSIVCSLLGIQTAKQMSSYPLRGAIFETMVIGEFVKKRTNAALPINLFYWRDLTGHEIDLIIDKGEVLLPVEIKSGKTTNKDFFKNLDYWCKLSGATKSVLMYAGDQTQKRSNGAEVMNWRELISKEF
ncbi:MAG: ATP-binding protein [Bacteroidia bacterium]|nr:ATP-binding protein [Bacteroidia bacterium]MCF8445544.1 ATP-binding protein [Bacteroidia bacterium]